MSYVSKSCLRCIYNTLVYPHLLYCSALWGGAYESSIRELFISQKKLLLTMTFKQRFDHTNLIFKDVRLLMLLESNLNLMCFTFLPGIMPSLFFNLPKNSFIHRKCQNLSIYITHLETSGIWPKTSLTTLLLYLSLL